ncbi:hypothetical protein V8C35DRAFT_309362 [Trichoderma chlorosporum]
MTDRSVISSSAFGNGTKIHQGDNIIHNYGSNASPKAYSLIPFPRNEGIVQRPAIFTQLDQLLSSSLDGEYCDAALWGLGGSGKSQIALDYAYRRSRDDPACAVFWVHADSETSFGRDYQMIARKLGLDHTLSGHELFLTVRYGIESQTRWLLILDNTDDVTLFGISMVADQTKSLLAYIPRGPGGTVLWTSRDEQIIALAGPRRGIQVPHMTVKEAEELFSMVKEEGIRNDEIQDAETLLQELQRLPLAISQAGSYMRKTSTPIKAYLSKLLEGRSKWDMLKQSQYDKHRRPDGSNSILETWDISIRQVRQESEITYKILNTLAYVYNENIPQSLIVGALRIHCRPEQEHLSESEGEVANAAIIRLKELSIISARKATNDDEPSFDMHKLVQEAIQYRLKAEDDESELYFSNAALRLVALLFPESRRATWPACEKYAMHAIRVSGWAETSENMAGTFAFLARASSYFLESGFSQGAEHMAKMELSLKKKVLGEEHLDVVTVIMRLTTIYASRGLFANAMDRILEALALLEKLGGENDERTAFLLASGARIFEITGKYRKAEAFRVKLLSLQQKLFGEKSMGTIAVMKELASLYDAQHMYHKASELKQKVMEFLSETIGEEHPATIEAKESLAVTYTLRGRLKEAEELRMGSRSSLQETFPGESGERVLDSLTRLAHKYRYENQYEKARDVWENIVSLEEQNSLEEGRSTTQSAKQQLVAAYCRTGEIRKAQELQLNVLAWLQTNYRESTASKIFAAIQMASIYYNQGLIKEGEPYEAQALSMNRELYGTSRLKPRFGFDRLRAERLAASAELHNPWTALELRAYKMTGWVGQVFFILLLVSGSIVTTVIWS